MTTQEYWKKIRAIAAEFDPDALARDKEEEDPNERTHLRRSQKACWLTSRENPEKGSVAGRTIEARPYLAGECIFSQTHVKATDQEIAAEILRRDQKRADINEEERVRKGNHSQDIGKAIAESLLAGQAAQAAQKLPRSRGEN